MACCDIRRLIRFATGKGYIKLLEEYPAIDIEPAVRYNTIYYFKS
jgi:hypothetical protein